MMHGRGRGEDAATRLQRRHIAAKRRNKSNPWFKRGTLYRKALDVLRTATGPMTGADIARAVLAANNVTDASR
jgi:hypothetical protein